MYVCTNVCTCGTVIKYDVVSLFLSFVFFKIINVRNVTSVCTPTARVTDKINYTCIYLHVSLYVHALYIHA